MIYTTKSGSKFETSLSLNKRINSRSFNISTKADRIGYTGNGYYY